MTKRLAKRKLQAMITKNNILEIALPMIKQKGFDNVSVDEICMAAGIAKGTFYHYFETKENIFGHTGLILDDLTLEKLLHNKNISSIDKIFLIVDAYMQFAQSEGIDITRHVFKSFINGTNVFMAQTTERQILENIINEGIERKEIIADINAEEIIDLVFTFATGLIVYWCNTNGSYDLTIKSKYLLEKWLRATLTANNKQ